MFAVLISHDTFTAFPSQICGIDVSRCRVMESKKKPLWLTLKNADTGGDIQLMLKVRWCMYKCIVCVCCDFCDFYFVKSCPRQYVS